MSMWKYITELQFRMILEIILVSDRYLDYFRAKNFDSRWGSWYRTLQKINKDLGSNRQTPETTFVVWKAKALNN